ncbi:unnamed protein product, partial [Prorocentrum cordatum]
NMQYYCPTSIAPPPFSWAPCWVGQIGPQSGSPQVRARLLPRLVYVDAAGEVVPSQGRRQGAALAQNVFPMELTQVTQTPSGRDEHRGGRLFLLFCLFVIDWPGSPAGSLDGQRATR